MGIWINWERNSKTNLFLSNFFYKGCRYILSLLLSVVCILALLHDYNTIIEDISEPYSNGKSTEAFMKENIQDDAVIMTDAQPECCSIFPYLNTKDFIYAPNGDFYIFVTWDDRYNIQMDYDDFIQYVTKFDSDERPIYLISAMGHSGIQDVERLSESFELIYQSPYGSLK